MSRPALPVCSASEKKHEHNEADFGIDVQLFAPYTFDAVMVLANAMQQARSGNPEIYRPYLREIHYNGIIGNIAIDDRGDLHNGILSLYT